MLQGVIFDFDGVIFDTETPLFIAWQRTYEHFGVEPIPAEEWSRSLGRNGEDPASLDPMARLSAAVDGALDVEHAGAIRRGHRDRLLEHLPIRPGVAQLLDQADELGIPVAIASSSSVEWIERHLRPHGLLARFRVLSCAGAGVPGKPHPAVYERAAAAMRIDASGCLAIEDSPNGTTAAKAAGMACVAVPNGLSRDLDFAHADRIVSSLAEVSLPDWQAPASPLARGDQWRHG